MDLSLDRNQIVIKPSQSKYEGPTYVGAGIFDLEVVEFRDWNEDEKAKSKSNIPFTSLTLIDKGTGAIHVERFYMGETSAPYSISKISHIVSMLCPSCVVSEMNTTEKIANGIIGKSGRWKICGEEVISKNGRKYVRATNFPKVNTFGGETHGFVERLEQTPTHLTFDPTNTRDVRPLGDKPGYSGPVVRMENVKGEEVADDLPF